MCAGRNPACRPTGFEVYFSQQDTTQMKMLPRISAALGASLSLLLVAGACRAADPAKDTAASSGMVPLILKLPEPAFKGTPKEMPPGLNVEPLSDKPRPPMMVPAGLKNIAAEPGVKITCSDKNATPDMLAKIVDGDKEASEQSIIYLRKGVQWVQMDFGSPQQIFAVVIWHAHNSQKVYRGVVVQVSDDPDFINGVKTLFNDDHENLDGLGVGADRQYFETREGKLIDAKGVKARYIRFYSKGSTESALNEYTEIEVYGRPAK
jgi:NedA-like, galactose-binding domain